MDSRVLGATAAAETEIVAHLRRHCLDPAVVELARPLVARALASGGPGCAWLTLDWEGPLARLVVRPLGDGPMPGALVAPGLSRAHHHAGELAGRPDVPGGVQVELGVARAPEGDLDPGPADPDLLPADQPLALIGLLATGSHPGLTLEEAAARAGSTVAAGRISPQPPAADPADVAGAVITAEAELGADFRLVAVSPGRAVIANRRCPFGPAPAPGLCRFTSALAGTIAARAAGGAEVTLDERLALGDHQCRLSINLGPGTGGLTSHRYRCPPAGLPLVEEPAATAVTTPGFRVTLSLQLPRDRLSVPVTRHLVSAAMEEVGVLPEDAQTVELALTEACANVIDHSGPGDAYEVSVTLGPSACHIRVVDIGRGFDHSVLGSEMAAVDAEHGRGVALMHALVDHVRFESEPERGTVVHLVKMLRFDDETPARRLMLAGLDPSEKHPEPD